MSASENAAPNEWLESMLGEFLDESSQLLDRLNENLLQLDALVRSEMSDGHACCDEALLNEMFRSAHSLKGLSGMLGLSDINNLTHRLENVFDAARKEGLPVTGEVVELMFQAVDHLDKLIGTLKTPDAEPVACDMVIERIRQLLESHGVERKQTSQADAEKALADLAHSAAGDASVTAVAASTVLPGQDGGERSDPIGPDVEPDPFDGIADEVSVADKYVSIFIDEAGLSLDRFSEGLLSLENSGNSGNLKDLLQIAHQIKGSAATVGLNRPAKLSHLIEDLLQHRVNCGGVLSPEATEALLQCSDRLRQYVDGLKQGRMESDGFGRVAHLLMAAQAGQPCASRGVSGGTGVPRDPTVDDDVSSIQSFGIPVEFRRRVEAAVPPGTPAVIGQVRFQAQLPMAGLKAQLVYNKLANLGEVCCFDPPPQQLDDIEVLQFVAFGLITDKLCDAVRERLAIAGVEALAIEAIPGGRAGADEAASVSSAAGPTTAGGPETNRTEPSRPAANAEPSDGSPRGRGAAADIARAPTETLRVDIEQLDRLMNLSGQLVITKARFAQFGDRLKTLRSSKRWVQSLARLQSGLERLGSDDAGNRDRQSAGEELDSLRSQARRFQNELGAVCGEMLALETMHDSINELFEATHQLDRVSDAVQQAVMDARMVPIGPLFNRFKRVIRDITRVNGKDVRLLIRGEKTKLDKRMIDELGDPLIHMVRNSVDHGIELPEVREAAGKPRQGTLTLDAFHRGNHVVIQVRDDGAGLNTDRILRKCLEKGLLQEADAQKMTPHQIHQMIWAPGLSTAEKVTEVSGRGMGMDIVKSKIELLHGTVDLQSEHGRGILLSIKLPLTLAIQPSLLVDIGGDVFAMPMEAVIEIVRLPRDKVSTIHGHRTAWVRQRAISVVELDRVFQWTGRSRRRRSGDSDEATIVIVGETASELGLEVDCVLGEQDAVVKSISENYANVAGITGASILGDGRVSLILDIAALIQMAASRPAATTLLEERT